MADGKIIVDTALDNSGIMNGLSKLSDITKSGFGLLTKAVGAASSGLAAAATGAIMVGSNFEEGMSKVAAISGATGDDLDALTEKAKEMGASTKFSATESAAAMEYMAMAGWKTEDMLNGIDGIMNLAAASGEDLATTSDIVTDALTAFGLSASDSGHFADVLAAASSNANTNVSMMGETFKYVAPVAGALGFSAEDCATAIGLMANAGIKSSQAGTSLRSMMSRLTKPTDEVQSAMNALGVSLTDEQGNMLSLNDIMEDLREGFSGLSEAEAAEMASSLAGQEAMSGLLAIVNASDEDFENLRSSIYNCDGTAQQMAETMQDNLKGSITILKSSLEGLGIEVYDGLAAPLKDAADQAIEYVNQLTDAFKSGGLSGLVEEAGDIFAEISVKAAEQAPKLVQTALNMIQSFVSGLRSNSAALAGAAANIVSTLVSGITSLIPELLFLAADLVLQFAQSMLDQAPQMIESGANMMTNLFAGFQDRLPDFAALAVNLIQVLTNGIIDNLAIISESGLSMMQTLVDSVVDSLPLIIGCGISILSELLNGIAIGLPGLVQMGLDLVSGLVSGIISNIPLVLSSATSLVSNLVSGIQQMLPNIIQSGILLIISLIQGIIANLGNIVQSAIQIVLALAQGLVFAIPQLLAAVPQLVGAIIDTILNTNWLDVGLQIATGILQGLWDGITGLFGSIWDGITSLFEDGGEAAAAECTAAIESGLTSATGDVQSAAESLADAETAGLSSNSADIVNVANNDIDTFTDTMTAGIGSVNIAGNELATSFVGSVDAGLSDIGSVAANATIDLSSAFQGGIGVSSADGVNTASAYVSGLTTGISDINTTAFDMVTSFTDTIEDGKDAVQEAAQSIGDAFSDGLNAANFDINAASQVNSAILQILTAISNQTSNVQAKAKAIGTAVANGFKGSNFGTLMASTANTSIRSVLTAINNAIGTVTSAGRSIGMAVVEGVRSANISQISSIASIAANAFSAAIASGNGSSSSAGARLAMAAISGARSTDPYGNGYSIGGNLVSGMAAGISANSYRAEAQAKAMANKAYNSAKNALSIHSPSRKGMYLGEMFDTGIAGGVGENADIVADAAGEVSQKLVDSLDIRNAVSNMRASVSLETQRIASVISVNGSGTESGDPLIDYQQMAMAIMYALQRSGIKFEGNIDGRKVVDAIIKIVDQKLGELEKMRNRGG